MNKLYEKLCIWCYRTLTPKSFKKRYKKIDYVLWFLEEGVNTYEFDIEQGNINKEMILFYKGKKVAYKEIIDLIKSE